MALIAQCGLFTEAQFHLECLFVTTVTIGSVLIQSTCFLERRLTTTAIWRKKTVATINIGIRVFAPMATNIRRKTRTTISADDPVENVSDNGIGEITGDGQSLDTGEDASPAAKQRHDGQLTLDGRFKWSAGWGCWVPTGQGDTTDIPDLEFGPLMPDRLHRRGCWCQACWDMGLRYGEYLKARKVRDSNGFF